MSMCGEGCLGGRVVADSSVSASSDWQPTELNAARLYFGSVAL